MLETESLPREGVAHPGLCPLGLWVWLPSLHLSLRLHLHLRVQGVGREGGVGLPPSLLQEAALLSAHAASVTTTKGILNPLSV